MPAAPLPDKFASLLKDCVGKHVLSTLIAEKTLTVSIQAIRTHVFPMLVSMMETALEAHAQQITSVWSHLFQLTDYVQIISIVLT